MERSISGSYEMQFSGIHVKIEIWKQRKKRMKWNEISEDWSTGLRDYCLANELRPISLTYDPTICSIRHLNKEKEKKGWGNVGSSIHIYEIRYSIPAKSNLRSR